MAVDVICLGEILVDWISTTPGVELDQAPTLSKSSGGAPANTAVGLARQGISTGFIGGVADDVFGNWLVDVLKKEEIDISGAVRYANAQTRMAYVVTTANGDRKLAAFSHIACADACLAPQDLDAAWIGQTSVLHFGSISLIGDSVASATRKAVEIASAHHAFISYDPNIRLGLWASPEQCKTAILNSLSWADAVKINEEELLFLTGSSSFEAADQLRADYSIPMLLVTLDARGAYLSTAKGSQAVPGFPVCLVEATGAGDGFNAGIIAGLLPAIKESRRQQKSGRGQVLELLSLAQLEAIVYRANAIGALVCTRAGAMAALPHTNDIDAFMAQHNHLSVA